MSAPLLCACAGVFTELIQQIGVSGVQVEELYDLDPSHLARISPVFGLIFLFKYQASPLDNSTQTLITPDNPLNDGIYFARQMITNACGTQAILNLLLNIDDATAEANGIRMGSEIRNFKEFTQFLPADVRTHKRSTQRQARQTAQNNAHVLTRLSVRALFVCVDPRCAARLSRTLI